MPDKHDITRLTTLYWAYARVPGLEVGSATLGLRYGLVIALRQPNYARAYLEATRDMGADRFEVEAVKEFMKAVPLMVGGDGHAT